MTSEAVSESPCWPTKSRDTGPELALRRELRALGLRYLVDARPIPALNRRADVVFRGARLAVFVDGCFWHMCPEHCKVPATGYWRAKLEGNRERDRDTDIMLAAGGWWPHRVWEHDVKADAAAVARVVQVVLATRAR